MERAEHDLAECARRVTDAALRNVQSVQSVQAPVPRVGDAAGDLAQRIARLSPEGLKQLETALGSIERGDAGAEDAREKPGGD